MDEMTTKIFIIALVRFLILNKVHGLWCWAPFFGGYRGRSALRRHGPFRSPPHPPDLVRSRFSGPDLELFRSRRAAPGSPGSSGTSVLRHGAFLGDDPKGGTDHPGHHHRFPGRDQRRLSLTTQAIQLGFLPRLHVRHTSAKQIGQIYVAPVNWMLMVCTVALVAGFQSSSKLAAAYGVAVTSTMIITSITVFGGPAPLALAFYWVWCR